MATLLLLIATKIVSSQSKSYLINTSIECHNDYALEGRFKFLDDKAEAYWHLEHDKVYFEYYFPSIYWIGIAASNQYIDDKYNFCVDCYKENKDISHCLTQCVGDNYFIATSKGDNDPNIPWNILEFKLNQQLNLPTKLQSVFGIKGRENAKYNLEKVILNDIEYIHGSWIRELNLNEKNKWIQPINNIDDICWTIITSKPYNPKARRSQNTSFIDKDSIEIHCDVGQNKICNNDIPHFSIKIADDVCQDKNVSLIILMDASLSINNYFDLSKSWIISLLENTKNISIRSSLIIFDHSPNLIWNFDEFNGFNLNLYNDIINNIKKQRLSGSHIKDTLEYTVNNLFPKMNKNDKNIVLMLSDGKPSSCYNDHDQNPCQLAPNFISKSFNDLNVKFLIIDIGKNINKQTFECLYKNEKEMDDSIITHSSYFELNSLHFCGLNNYQCNIDLFPSQSLSQKLPYNDYIKHWNFVSYRFIVNNNYDIWPYYVSIKLHSECKYPIDFIAKLFHYDPISKYSNLIKESDQILKVSNNNNNNNNDNDEYKFSFKGSSIDQITGNTLFNKLKIGEIYIIEFHLINDINNNLNKCQGLNKLKVINSPQTDYNYINHYFIDISSSIAFIDDNNNNNNNNNNNHYSIPSQTDHPLVSLCIAERLNNNKIESETEIETETKTETEIEIEIKTETKTETLQKQKAEIREKNKNECRRPKYFPAPISWNKCDENRVEWNIDFSNWFYNKYKDETYIEYNICVLSVPPYNSCKYMDKTSKAISSILFQIPCFCEVCLNEITSSMKPKYGFTTEIHQGWIWEYLLYPGQCQKYEIILDGYISMDYGYYKIMGNNIFIEGIIQVPNPCQPSIGYPMDYYLIDNNTDDDNNNTDNNADDDDDDNICYYDEAMYPDHECSFICDGYQDNEWRLEYISKYNQNGNTIFIYNVYVDGDIDKYQCAKRQHSESQSLSKIYLRLGCDCKYQSKTFLESMTVKLEPFGVVNENYWSWNVNIEKDQIQELKIILKGENIEMGYSEMTLVGSDRRCTSFNKILVPNPCKNECNFGQFTEWTSFGQCSVECGGGYKYKTRRCVSICDGITQVDNCYGDNNFMSPCNTHSCI